MGAAKTTRLCRNQKLCLSVQSDVYRFWLAQLLAPVGAVSVDNTAYILSILWRGLLQFGALSLESVREVLETIHEGVEAPVLGAGEGLVATGSLSLQRVVKRRLGDGRVAGAGAAKDSLCRRYNTERDQHRATRDAR